MTFYRILKSVQKRDRQAVSDLYYPLVADKNLEYGLWNGLLLFDCLPFMQFIFLQRMDGMGGGQSMIYWQYRWHFIIRMSIIV